MGNEWVYNNLFKSLKTLDRHNKKIHLIADAVYQHTKAIAILGKEAIFEAKAIFIH